MLQDVASTSFVFAQDLVKHNLVSSAWVCYFEDKTVLTVFFTKVNINSAWGNSGLEKCLLLFNASLMNTQQLYDVDDLWPKHKWLNQYFNMASIVILFIYSVISASLTVAI